MFLVNLYIFSGGGGGGFVDLTGLDLGILMEGGTYVSLEDDTALRAETHCDAVREETGTTFILLEDGVSVVVGEQYAVLELEDGAQLETEDGYALEQGL